MLPKNKYDLILENKLLEKREAPDERPDYNYSTTITIKYDLHKYCQL